MPLPHGSNLAVGETASQLTEIEIPIIDSVRLRALAANADESVYVGFSDTVTAATEGDTDGYELNAGDEVIITRQLANKLSDIWIISSSGTLAVSWLINGGVHLEDVPWALLFQYSDMTGLLALI